MMNRLLDMDTIYESSCLKAKYLELNFLKIFIQRPPRKHTCNVGSRLSYICFSNNLFFLEGAYKPYDLYILSEFL